MSTLISSTCGSAGTLATLRLDGDRIEQVASSPIGKGCAALALDTSGRRGFVATKEPVAVHGVELDEQSGRWTTTSTSPVDDSMTYLALSGDGRFLLGVSYGGGFGQVWPVGDDGLGRPTARIEFANLHCVIELDGFVYAVSLGEDLVACYRLGDDGGLTPLEVPTVAAPQGSGPRHLAVAEDRRNLYLVTEFSGEVVRLERDTDTGTLTAREKVAIFAPDRGLKHSRIGADPAAEHLVWGADVHVAGRWLVASERCESTLASVPLDEQGHLGEVACLVDTEKQPRGFGITADGRQVVCPGEKSDHTSLFSLDGQGILTLLCRTATDEGGTWVRPTR